MLPDDAISVGWVEVSLDPALGPAEQKAAREREFEERVADSSTLAPKEKRAEKAAKRAARGD